MTLIFFFSESWDVAFYKSNKKGTPKGTPDEIFYYENMKKVDFFRMYWSFQTKIHIRVSPWMSPFYQFCKKQYLRFHWKKKINVISFLDKFLNQNEC